MSMTEEEVRNQNQKQCVIGWSEIAAMAQLTSVIRHPSSDADHLSSDF